MSVFTPPHEAGHARSRRKGLALPQAAATSTGVHELLDRVGNRIAPLWPLDDYVAVNPFAGLAAHSFLAARRQLRSFSDCETLMPLAYYADQLRRGALSIADLEQALVDCPSLPADGPVGMTAEDIFAQLMAIPTGTGLGDLSVPAANRARRLHTVSESLDRATGSEWTEIILEEIAKVAAAHYDEGQAFWKSPWQHLSLYEAWQRAMRHDRQVELLGLTGFRQRVAKLPADPVEAIPMLLRDIGVPTHLWEPFLLCQLFTMPGWSAWVRYQDDAARRKGEDSAELTGLLAIRLALRGGSGAGLRPPDRLGGVNLGGGGAGRRRLGGIWCGLSTLCIAPRQRTALPPRTAGCLVRRQRCDDGCGCRQHPRRGTRA